jgi:DNA-binding winged helix-turn-helix (wHTH) protein
MAACLQEKWYIAEAGDEVTGAEPSPAFEPLRLPDPASSQDLGPIEFRFGRWCLVPRARLLLRDGEPVELGSRAFDLLHLLLCQRGFIVEKSAIVSFVWPNTIVEESNLRFQMATLRKALGEDRSLIKTIPGRGYIFAAEYKLAG